MEKRDEPIVDVLYRENEAFRREMDAHHRYEAILEEFNRRTHLTPDEEMERKKIQKLKLAGKDRMFRMIEAYRAKHEGAAGGRT